MTLNWDDRHGIRLWVKKDASIAVLGLEIFFPFFPFLFFGGFLLLITKATHSSSSSSHLSLSHALLFGCWCFRVCPLPPPP